MNGSNLKGDTVADPQATATKVDSPPDCPVLIAIDFSPDSESALVWACDYAGSIGAPLEILHVVHDPAHAPGTYRAEDDDPLEPMGEVAERRLATFCERVGRDNPGLPGLDSAKLNCVSGLPAARILDVAQSRSAQLLVLGGGRRTGLGRLLRGSTANEVARQARFPVTIVKAGD